MHIGMQWTGSEGIKNRMRRSGPGAHLFQDGDSNIAETAPIASSGQSDPSRRLLVSLAMRRERGSGTMVASSPALDYATGLPAGR